MRQTFLQLTLTLILCMGFANAWGETRTITLSSADLALVSSGNAGSFNGVSGNIHISADEIKGNSNGGVEMKNKASLWNTTPLSGGITSINITQIGAELSFYFGNSEKPTENEIKINSISTQSNIPNGPTYFCIKNASGNATTFICEITYKVSEADNDVTNTEKINISAVEIATFVNTSGKTLDFSNCNDISAYTANVNTAESKVSLTPVKKVPNGAAIIVKGKQGSHLVPKTDDAINNFSNDLISSGENGHKPSADETCYILAKLSNGSVGFGKVDAKTTISANKAYFKIAQSTATSAASFRISFESSETTDLEIDEPDEVPMIIRTMAGKVIPAVTEDGLYIVTEKKSTGIRWMMAK